MDEGAGAERVGEPGRAHPDCGWLPSWAWGAAPSELLEVLPHSEQ